MKVKQPALGNVYNIDTLIEERKKYPPLKFIWSGIKEDSLGFFIGPSKTGKTTVAECLGMSIANGNSDFLGKKIIEAQTKVLFISLEEYWLGRIERNAKQRAQINALSLDNYLVLKEEYPTYLVNDSDWEIIANRIIESKAKLVIIDSLSRMYSGQIEDSAVAIGVMKKLRTLAAKCKISLIIIHHTTKLNGKPLTMDSIAGSRVIAQEADFCFGVGKTPDGVRYLKEIFFRYAVDSGDEVICFEINENQWIEPIEIISEASLLPNEQDGRANSKNTDIVYNTILTKSKVEKDGISSKELISMLVSGGKMSKPTLFAQLKSLANSGRIKKIERGNYLVEVK